MKSSKVLLTNKCGKQGLVYFNPSFSLSLHCFVNFGLNCCISESKLPANFGGTVFYSYNVPLVDSVPDAILGFTDNDDIVYVYTVDNVWMKKRIY